MTELEKLLQESNDLLKRVCDHFTKSDVELLKEVFNHQEKVNQVLKNTPEEPKTKENKKVEEKPVPEKKKEEVPPPTEEPIEKEEEGEYAWD